MGKILALDFGTKKFGVAISDEDQIIAQAQPLVYVKHDSDALQKITAIITNQSISTVLIGIPLEFNESASPFAKRILSFVQQLQSNIPDVPIETVNESMTSVQARGVAKEAKHKKHNIDGEAARIMLQEYLDYKNTV